MLKKKSNRMDAMEKMDLENQMTVLEGAAMEEEGGNVNDKVVDLSNSLKEIVQDDTVKPKLHCLMMDQAFSMVTLQSEDSGIHWETASSRCSTPWASEICDSSANLCTSLVPQSTRTSGLETGGNITVIMDEDQMIKKKKRKRDKAMMENPPHELGEPERPAMVEVSIPNVTIEKDSNEYKDRKQQLFRLVSEGTEILNIVVPPKVSTVDEEASKRLVDNLSYLEDTLVIKGSKITIESETSVEIETGNLEVNFPIAPEPLYVPPPIKPAQNGATSVDYFEKFTLLDHQALGLSGAIMAEGFEELEMTEQVENDGEDNATYSKPVSEVVDDSESFNKLDLTAEHVDEIFYGGGVDPEIRNKTRNGRHKNDLPKCPLKKSGSALFGSQESILTPIFLPEGPKKVIDLVLLEEPKAMAFMYSDLYADATGSRMKQDDTDSIISEKSFHSQDSDIEDRGYLEKFVLKDETPQTEDPRPDQRQQFGVTMWTQSEFGLAQHGKDNTVSLEDGDEMTDFFRKSANSSPCEMHVDQVKPKETKKKSKSRCVGFHSEASGDNKRRTEAGDSVSQPSESDVEITDSPLPPDAGMKSSVRGSTRGAADYKSIIAEFAVKMVSPKPCKPVKSAKAKPPKVDSMLISVPQTVKPITPQHKPFLDLTPLLPVDMPEEAEETGTHIKDVEVESCSCTAKRDEAAGQAQDYELTPEQEASESGLHGSAEEVLETVNALMS